MNYDKNGCMDMVIYCWNCSGHKHAKMNKNTGKGRCILIGKKLVDKEIRYKFQCMVCDSFSMWQNAYYVRQYAIK